MSGKASKRPVNFSPGPAILPMAVLEQAARDVIALEGVGLSILEISHRSPAFDEILEGTVERLRRLLAVPAGYDILFLQGGARCQFAQVPLNFLRPGKKAAYVLTGAWSDYALKEAKVLGEAWAPASGEGSAYAALPDLSGITLPANTAYLHTTSNNTIKGTQWQEMPDFGAIPHVSDMSSDILSRPIDVSRFGLIYAGAQKNAGPAGVTLVIVDKDWMETAREDIPSIWQYRIQARKGSTYNTPPVFAIHCVGLVTRWLEEQGGVAAIAELNEKKAAMVYDAIEASGGFYRCPVADPSHRSRMNAVWRISDEALEPRFVAEAAAAGLNNLKGHRSVGGLRASLYNAMPIEGVAELVDFMKEFARVNG